MKPGDVFNPFRLFTGILVPEALVKCRGLSQGAKLCYGRLARYAGENGDCHPSLATLARELGASRDQTRRYVQELVAGGLIRVKRRRTTAGDPDTSEVSFLWHIVFEDDGVGANMRLPGRGKNAPTVRAYPPVGVGANLPPKESHIKRVKEKTAAAWASCPETAAAVRGVFPTTDDAMVSQICQAARKVRPGATDASIAAAVVRSWRPGQRTAALYKTTVPTVLGHGPAERPAEIGQFEIACQICDDRGYRSSNGAYPASVGEVKKALAAGTIELCICPRSDFWRKMGAGDALAIERAVEKIGPAAGTVIQGIARVGTR